MAEIKSDRAAGARRLVAEYGGRLVAAVASAPRHRGFLFALPRWARIATAAVPVVSTVTTTQNASRRVTVNYTLSEEPGPRIVRRT